MPMVPSALTRKVALGPLPVAGWVLIGATAIGVVWYVKRGKKTTVTPSGERLQTLPVSPADRYIQSPHELSVLASFEGPPSAPPPPPPPQYIVPKAPNLNAEPYRLPVDMPERGNRVRHIPGTPVPGKPNPARRVMTTRIHSPRGSGGKLTRPGNL